GPGSSGSSGSSGTQRRGTGPLPGSTGSSDRRSSYGGTRSGGSGSGGLPGSTGSNRSGSASSGGSSFQRNKPGSDKDRDDRRPAASKGRNGDKDKGEEKKGSPVEASLTGIRSRFGRFGGGKDGDDADKKDGDRGNSAGNPASGLIAGASGALGGLRGRLPFGGSSDDVDADNKKDDKKPAASKGKDAKSDGKKPTSGGAGSRFGRKGTSGDADVKPADKKDDKKGTPRFGARAGTSLKPSDDKKGGKSDKAEKKDEAAAGGGIAGRFSALTASLPFGGSEADKPASKTVKQRSKAPKVAASEGLSLDRKLDILGVGLVFVSAALLLSRLSANQGMLTEGINNFFESLLGWGAWAVPVAMFGVGMWLIIRHFGDEPPTIDTERLIGVGILYISLLVVFQFVHALNYSVTTFDELANLTRLTWEEPMFIPSGGGWVGGNLYLLMVQYLGEILAFALVVFTLIVGLMLLLDVSVSEVAIIMIGLWRSFSAARRRSSQRKKVRKAERLAKRQEQLAAISQSNIEISTPQVEQLAAGNASPTAGIALPAPENDQRAIPITMGGRTVTTSMDGEQVAAQVPAGVVAPQQAQAQSAGNGGSGRGGLMGGLFGRSNRNAASAAPRASNPQPAAPANGDSNGGSSGGGLMSRLPFGGSGNAGSGNGQQAAPQAQAAPPTSAQTTPPPTMPGQPSIPSSGSGAAQQPAANLFAAPPATAPPPAHSAPVPAINIPGSASGGNGSGNGDSTPSADPAKNVLENKRISQVMETVKPEDAADEKDDTTDDSPTDPQSRADRLNAIRQGQSNHPRTVQSQAGTPGGAAAPATASQPPESASPTAPATPAPPAAAASATNGAAEATGAAFVAGKTDAYGNAPTPPTSVSRPDQMKPEPSAVPPQSNRPKKEWKLPTIEELFNDGSDQDFDRQFLVEQARIIEDTLKSFGAPGRVVEINTGPVITQYGVEPDYLQSRSGKRSRVKVSAIAQLDRDLQLALGAKSIRIEAPVPGKGYVGVEIPNAENALVSLKDVMKAEQFQKISGKSPLAIALGQSVDGTPIAADLASMPHMLIAGTTGSGKSVCINSIISSLLSNNSPEDLKLIMVDPKRVELTGYNGIPHLVAPVVVELERIVGVLKWVTREMDERYKRFSGAGARNIVDFNKHLPSGDTKMPYIVVIIDELADLMMLAPEETERTITRIAALARATGIHLVIATQRPSVDVVTGLIKANFPARAAFAVAGSVDSRVILDQPGAERLLGRGDMLYLSGSSPSAQRLQGVFVSDDEIDNLTRYWKAQGAGYAPAPTRGMAPMTLDPASAPRQVSPSVMPGATPERRENQPELPMQQAFWDGGTASNGGGANGDEPDDELYTEAVETVRRLNKASVSLLQRRLRIGYTRASRLIDLMEQRGVVGPQESGSKPREVIPQ
ncbi:MAG: DNA translocase FtsK 4TM domain-containing protein, partial [Chloroflexota bacterium]